MQWRHTIILAALLSAIVVSGLVEAAEGAGTAKREDAARFALRYAEALANARIDEWAAADLACLSRKRIDGALVADGWTRDCWNATLTAHRAMVAQEAETGVFDAIGRGAGLGLLHERHRASDNWKEYPPAVFLSPPIVRRDHGPAPHIAFSRLSPPERIALTRVAGSDPVTLRGQAVDLTVSYRDPMTAPLALRPEEVWWVSGAQRRFGPVREVQIRFIVVSGLRQYGYAQDRAVMNEALPGAPLIPTTQYGLRPDAGRRFETTPSGSLLKGELLPGSARWWERAEADSQYTQAIGRAAHLPAGERTGLLTRLLLLDPTDPDANAMRADDAYAAFLRQGVTKAGLAAGEDAALWREAELYWTIQAQTWRQELTAVAEGYEPAADMLYRAIASYETLLQGQRATSEQRRRLGVLNRWNNDPAAALAIHQPLLAETPPGTPFYGLVLADIAWDRIQWVSWERRYDHPWLNHAATEARQAAALLDQPHDKLLAEYVLIAVESLRVPRDRQALHRQLEIVKQDVGRIPGTKGLLGHLLANDLVKALTMESTTIVLPSPTRSMDVLDVAVHASPPKQDIVWQWNFDRDVPGGLPAGFAALPGASSESSGWQALADPHTPAGNQIVASSSPCPAADCARLLVAERVRATYPDLTVAIRPLDPSSEGESGLALAVQDERNYYAITLQPPTGMITTRRVTDGATAILGRVPVKLGAQPWHTIRVQRINFLHLDKGRLAVYVDGAQVAAVDDAVLPPEGLVGLVTIGPAAVHFDNLHLLDLVSNRPLSKPAAY